MCGLAGFVGFGRDPQQSTERLSILRAMGAQIAHRGPDDEQFYDDDALSLVFRRLSIVDVHGGRQPIWNEDESAFVCVNGEIYNHKELRQSLRQRHTFRTQSDSEIALHLYEEVGPALAERLGGMFVVVLWDKRAQRLLLIRDRLGIKPLYLAETSEGLLFGSELKALLAHPLCPRKLRWGDLDEDRLPIDRVPTYVEDVEFLPGGCHAIYDARGLRIERYWSLEPSLAAARDSTMSASQYEERYRELFFDSVRMRLMSDVPVGAFLSGGVDSAALVAAAAAHGAKLRSFNVITRTTARNGDAGAARAVADALDLPLHHVAYDEEHLVEQLDMSLAAFEGYVWMMDSPRFDPVWLYTHSLHHFVKHQFPKTKVILLGQGADEFAGGYSMPQGSTNQSWQEYLHRDLIALHRLRTGVPQSIAAMLARPSDADIFQHEMRIRLWALQWFNLWHEDRTSSVEGMESRVPFLDHRLVELLASVPAHLQAELFTDKHIVRETAKAWLPLSLAKRAKAFFYYDEDMRPVDKLFRRIVNRTIDEFREKYVVASDFPFDRASFERLVDASAGLGPHGARSLRMVVHCMTISIFQRICERTASFTKQPLSMLPVLPEIDRAPADWTEPPPVVDARPWSSGDSAEIAFENRIALVLGNQEEPRLLMCHGNEILADLELPDSALVELLRYVADPARSHTVADLAKVMGVDEADCSYALQFLAERGWVVRIEETENAAGAGN